MPYYSKYCVKVFINFNNIINMVVNKIIGLMLLLFGFWTLKYFPDNRRFQREEMTFTGIMIGIVMFLIGLGLLIFG